MENNIKKKGDNQLGKAYQIPELVDLNVVGEAMGGPGIACANGSTPTGSCSAGSHLPG